MIIFQVESVETKSLVSCLLGENNKIINFKKTPKYYSVEELIEAIKEGLKKLDIPQDYQIEKIKVKKRTRQFTGYQWISRVSHLYYDKNGKLIS